MMLCASMRVRRHQLSLSPFLFLFPFSRLFPPSSSSVTRLHRLPSTQSPIGRSGAPFSHDITTSASETPVSFHAIDDVEPFFRYGPGGYHPVSIGDRLGARYRVLHKLGHGSYSTVWLARDEKLQKLVAVKVNTPDASPRESEIISFLNDSAKVHDDSDASALGRGMIPHLLDSFNINGPHGTHTCIVTDLARCSVIEAKRHGHYAPLMLPVARAIAAQLVLAVAYLHRSGVVHGGGCSYLPISSALLLT